MPFLFPLCTHKKEMFAPEKQKLPLPCPASAPCFLYKSTIMHPYTFLYIFNSFLQNHVIAVLPLPVWLSKQHHPSIVIVRSMAFSSHATWQSVLHTPVSLLHHKCHFGQGHQNLLQYRATSKKSNTQKVLDFFGRGTRT